MNFIVNLPAGYQFIDKLNSNIDIRVILETGEEFVGTLFTINNIINLMSVEEHKDYLWASNMVIVRDVNLESINSCVMKMIEDNLLEVIFFKMGQ